MMYAIIAAILIILICILFLPLKVVASYKEKKTAVRIYLGGVRVFRLKLKEKGEKPSKTPDEKVEKLEKDTRSLGEKIKHFADIFKTAVRLLRRYVSIHNINLKIDVGTGEAATTAVSSGVLWGAIYGLLGIIGSIVYINRHNVKINPVYTNAAFSIEGECIIKSRIAYIIFIAITILIKIKSRKGKEE